MQGRALWDVFGFRVAAPLPATQEQGEAVFSSYAFGSVEELGEAVGQDSDTSQTTQDPKTEEPQ